MSYEIRFAPASVRDIRKLPAFDQERVLERIRQLGDSPWPTGSVKLRNSEDLYRIRLGDLRIIYQVQDNCLLVIVVNIAQMDKAYR